MAGWEMWQATSAKPFRLVWRVENMCGDGPYTADGAPGYYFYHKRAVWPGACKAHPRPHESWRADKRLLYGFVSMRQLQEWFKPRVLERITRDGYVVVCRRASLIYYDRFQAAFLPYKSAVVCAG